MSRVTGVGQCCWLDSGSVVAPVRLGASEGEAAEITIVEDFCFLAGIVYRLQVFYRT